MTPLQSFHASRACRSRRHCDTCRASQEWRASVGKGHGLTATAKHWGCPRPGLGDLVALALRWTGVKALWKWLNSKPCGCAKRQAKLNSFKLLRFKLTW